MRAEQFKKIDPVVSVYCKVCTFPVLFSFYHILPLLTQDVSRLPCFRFMRSKKG
jgi:hypothetical protein